MPARVVSRCLQQGEPVSLLVVPNGECTAEGRTERFEECCRCVQLWRSLAVPPRHAILLAVLVSGLRLVLAAARGGVLEIEV
jgi:hypothetical protein